MMQQLRETHIKDYQKNKTKENKTNQDSSRFGNSLPGEKQTQEFPSCYCDLTLHWISILP